MSSMLPSKQISTKCPYSKVEAVQEWNTDRVQHAPHSYGAPTIASNTTVNTTRATRKRKIPLAEPCFITKRSSYMHEMAHWVNAVRRNAAYKNRIERLLRQLGIVQEGFSLDDPSNLTNLDRNIHVALDRYSFIAVTGSNHTLEKIIEVFEDANTRWQEAVDRGEVNYNRNIDITNSPFSDAQYELVVLYPEHFLPNRNDLTVYSAGTVPDDTMPPKKTYVVAPDRTLREYPGTDATTCPRLPSFSFDNRYRSDANLKLLNPLLVILNAHIKFRRYLRPRPTPPANPLPPYVRALIHTTIEVADLIYWKPRKPDSQAAAANRQAPVPAEMGASEGNPSSIQDDDIEMEAATGAGEPGEGSNPLGSGATLEERMNFMECMLS